MYIMDIIIGLYTVYGTKQISCAAYMYDHSFAPHEKNILLKNKTKLSIFSLEK